jgi:phospholipid N-methyltransferase
MELLGSVQVARAPRKKPASPLATFLGKYASIGAICESSPWLAKRMAVAVGETKLPILELGAGYGALTAMLPQHTVSIERDEKRFAHLKNVFPTRTILDQCAFAALSELKSPTVVVSSIPSVNNPEFEKLKNSIRHARMAGTVTNLVTYTYFPHDPFEGVFPHAERLGLELFNVPPAFVWRYTNIDPVHGDARA